MQQSAQIVFRNVDSSEALESFIKERIAKLERFHDRIIGCRVAVESDHSHQKGNLFQVRIDLTLPEKELVVSRNPEADHSHEDPYVAVRDAFNAMMRQLESYTGRKHSCGCGCAH